MKIKIFNLCQDINDKALERLFLPYGVVNSAEVSRNALNGRSNCNGIVEMPLENQAEQAIVSLDKTMVSGKVISVTRYVSDDSKW
jgi:RNA recognition motif-containing protein